MKRCEFTTPLNLLKRNGSRRGSDRESTKEGRTCRRGLLGFAEQKRQCIFTATSGVARRWRGRSPVLADAMHGSVLHHVLAAREGPQHVVEILGDQVLTLRPCNRLGSASKAVPLAGAGQGDEHVQKGHMQVG